jgi:hypothetical protein
MEHEDKIYNIIKNAAHKAESQDFPAMEKVWQRVENRLDHKVLKKENHLWKKIAVAASVLLVATLGYQLYRKDEVPIMQKQVVIQDTIHDAITPPQEDAIVQEAVHPTIKKNAEVILKHQTAEPQDVAVVNEAITVNDATVVAEEKTAGDQEAQEVDKAAVADDTEKHLRAKRSGAVNAASTSTSFGGYTTITKKEKQEVEARKNDPLLVVNGTSVTNKDKNSTLKTALSKLDPNDIESIEVLAEPLYIINGVHYSEAELFGPNPTSPYAPLNAQEIEKTTILQGTEATSVYGKKGEKGVVIITTKNEKPAAKKSK